MKLHEAIQILKNGGEIKNGGTTYTKLDGAFVTFNKHGGKDRVGHYLKHRFKLESGEAGKTVRETKKIFKRKPKKEPDPEPILTDEEMDSAENVNEVED